MQDELNSVSFWWTCCKLKIRMEEKNKTQKSVEERTESFPSVDQNFVAFLFECACRSKWDTVPYCCLPRRDVLSSVLPADRDRIIVQYGCEPEEMAGR